VTSKDGTRELKFFPAISVITQVPFNLKRQNLAQYHMWESRISTGSATPPSQECGFVGPSPLTKFLGP